MASAQLKRGDSIAAAMKRKNFKQNRVAITEGLFSSPVMIGNPGKKKAKGREVFITDMVR